MELFKTTEENIDKLVRKGLNSKSWILSRTIYRVFGYL